MHTDLIFTILPLDSADVFGELRVVILGYPKPTGGNGFTVVYRGRPVQLLQTVYQWRNLVASQKMKVRGELREYCTFRDALLDCDLPEDDEPHEWVLPEYIRLLPRENSNIPNSGLVIDVCS